MMVRHGIEHTRATIATMTTPLAPFKSLRYAGRAPGPRLIVLGAVHGNETCGTRAIERVLAELDSGALALAAGSVTFVPVSQRAGLCPWPPRRRPQPQPRAAAHRCAARVRGPRRQLAVPAAGRARGAARPAFVPRRRPALRDGRAARQQRAAGALRPGRARGGPGAPPGRGPRGRRLARHLCRRRGAAPPRGQGRRPRRGTGDGPALRRRHHRVHALGGRLRADAGMRPARRPGFHRGGLARHPQHAWPTWA